MFRYIDYVLHPFLTLGNLLNSWGICV